MKKLFLLGLLCFSITAWAQQILSPINLNDNLKLQWNGVNVKQKAILQRFHVLRDGSTEFYISVNIQYYENVSGTYGSKITDLINADQQLQTPTLSSDQAAQLLVIYSDRHVEHSTLGVCVDATSGNIVSCLQIDGVTPTVNAIAESVYWQTFKLNQVSGITSVSTQGAMDAIYKIAAAIVTKMNSRKNW